MPDSEKPVVKVMFQEIYLDSIRDLLDKTNFMTQNNQSFKYEPTSVAVSNADKVF